MNDRIFSLNKKRRANEIKDRRDEDYENLAQTLAWEQFHILGQPAKCCRTRVKINARERLENPATLRIHLINHPLIANELNWKKKPKNKIYIFTIQKSRKYKQK